MNNLKPIGPKPKDIYRDISLPLSVRKRCRKRQWAHYRVNESKACGNENKYRLFRGPYLTGQISLVTCPRCIEILKKSHWYCPEHGFIDDNNVTYEETCEFCGEPV